LERHPVDRASGSSCCRPGARVRRGRCAVTDDTPRANGLCCATPRRQVDDPVASGRARGHGSFGPRRQRGRLRARCLHLASVGDHGTTECDAWRVRWTGAFGRRVQRMRCHEPLCPPVPIVRPILGGARVHRADECSPGCVHRPMEAHQQPVFRLRAGRRRAVNPCWQRAATCSRPCLGASRRGGGKPRGRTVIGRVATTDRREVPPGSGRGRRCRRRGEPVSTL